MSADSQYSASQKLEKFFSRKFLDLPLSTTPKATAEDFLHQLIPTSLCFPHLQSKLEFFTSIASEY